MAVFGKGSQPSRLAQSDRQRVLYPAAFGGSARLNRGCGPHFPQSHIKRHFDNSATGPQGLSTIANILRISTGNLAGCDSLAVSRRPRREI